MSLFNQICDALGLFDGARPVSPESVLRDEVLPMIEALKTNNPEAGVLVREQQRVYGLWRDALAKMADANRRSDGFLQRYHECEADRQSLLRELKALRASSAPAAGEGWQTISTYEGNDYRPLYSPAHGQVYGAHVTGDVWHLIGVGAITSASERPTHWMRRPADPVLAAPRRDADTTKC